MTCLGVTVSGSTTEAIVYDSVAGHLTLNPHRLPSTLRDHLSAYVRDLNDPTQRTLRANFEKRFDMEYPPAATLATPIGGRTPSSGAISLLSAAATPMPVTPDSGSVQQSGVQNPPSAP